jgi:hypothetical protein
MTTTARDEEDGSVVLGTGLDSDIDGDPITITNGIEPPGTARRP